MGSQNEYDGIDIRVTGVDGGYYTDTTEALVLNNQTLNVKGKGKFVSIINTAQNKQIDNNGGIYAKGGSTVNFTDVDSIYIAAIAGKEGGMTVLSYLLKIRAATWRDIQILSIYPVLPFN